MVEKYGGHKLTKLEDNENYFLYNNNGDFFKDLSLILLKCEDDVFISKLKIIK